MDEAERMKKELNNSQIRDAKRGWRVYRRGQEDPSKNQNIISSSQSFDSSLTKSGKPTTASQNVKEKLQSMNIQNNRQVYEKYYKKYFNMDHVEETETEYDQES